MLLRATHCITRQLIEFTSYIAARKQGFYHRDIRACLQGKRKSYRGYYWSSRSNNSKDFDLLLKPKQLAKVKQISLKTAQYNLKYMRSVTGITKTELLRTQLETLILKQGVTIDECADKFNIKPQHICKIMGWE